LSKGLELRPGVTQNLVDLRLLVGIKLQGIQHALKAFLTRSDSGAPPSFVGIQCESASRESQHEYEYRSETHLPFPFVCYVHTYLRSFFQLPRLFVAAVDGSQQLTFRVFFRLSLVEDYFFG